MTGMDRTGISAWLVCIFVGAVADRPEEVWQCA